MGQGPHRQIFAMADFENLGKHRAKPCVGDPAANDHLTTTSLKHKVLPSPCDKGVFPGILPWYHVYA